jgi:succinoglycan biosynthesis transport protein ExoP
MEMAMTRLTETDDEINLADLGLAVKRHLKQILSVALGSMVLVGIVTFFWIPKQYQSDVAFYIHENNSSGMLSMLNSQLGALGGLLPSAGGGVNADLCSEIILARQFLKRVLKAEGQSDQSKDIKKFQKKITVKKGKSGVVSIAVLAKDPKLAYRLTRRIYTQYQEVVEKEIYHNNNTNRVFVEKQLSKSEARLERAEQNLLAYQQQNGVQLLPEEAGKAIENFAELEKTKMQVTIGLDEAKKRLQQADAVLDQSGEGVKESVRSAVNPVIQQYKLNLTEIEVRLAQERETLTDQHPTVKSLLAQRAGLMSKMQQEEQHFASPEVAGEYLKGLVEVAGLEARHDSLIKLYNTKQTQLKKLPKELLRYGQLLREQKVAEQIYILLVSQLEQARIAESKDQNVEIQTIDAPQVPDKKHSPSTLLSMVLTCLLTGFLGMGWAIFKEQELVFGKGTGRSF